MIPKCFLIVLNVNTFCLNSVTADIKIVSWFSVSFVPFCTVLYRCLNSASKIGNSLDCNFFFLPVPFVMSVIPVTTYSFLLQYPL